MRIAAYTRISTDEVNQPHSLGAQSERLVSYVASQEDWEMVGSFTDQMSGAKLERPGLTSASAHLVGLLLVAASVALVGCASGTSSTATTVATGRSVPSPSSSPTTATEAALNAYRAMWADLVDAARTSNFGSPLLPKHASGSTLTLLVQGLARDQEQNIVTRGSPIIDPKIISLSSAHNPKRASISDCFDNSHWLEYKNHGGLAKNTAPGRHATTAVLTNIDGAWKVTRLTIQAAGTC